MRPEDGPEILDVLMFDLLMGHGWRIFNPCERLFSGNRADAICIIRYARTGTGDDRSDGVWGRFLGFFRNSGVLVERLSCCDQCKIK